MSILVIVLFSLIIFSLWSWIKLLIDRKNVNIPGPFPYPIIGNGHLFFSGAKDFLPTLRRLQQEYNDIVLVYLFSVRHVILSHPKYIADILSSSELITKANVYNVASRWLGDGILMTTGAKWKSLRTFLTPAFHFKTLQSYMPAICSNQKRFLVLLHKVANGSPVNIVSLISLAALDTVAESIMGVTVGAQEKRTTEYVEATEALTSVVAKKMVNPILQLESVFGLTTYKKQETKGINRIFNFTNKVIKARQKELVKFETEKKDEVEEGTRKKLAFLDLILTESPSAFKYDTDSMIKEVNTFMFAGHDTTTSALTFCFYSLSINMDAQEKAYEEQKQIFGDDMERDPTLDDLQKMTYLMMVIKESLRLFPPAPIILRSITKDTTIGEKFIPKDTTALLNIYEVHRNPKVYVNADEFRPERFDETMQPFMWIPFSAGPRNCIDELSWLDGGSWSCLLSSFYTILSDLETVVDFTSLSYSRMITMGQKFAMMTLKIFISSVIRKFKLRPSGLEPKLSFGLTLQSTNGVYVKLLPR